MKLLYSFLFVLSFPLLSFAQLNGNGFYRVNNYKTGRYIYVCDNTGSINIQTTSADMGAIQLWSGYEKTISNPASVIYIKKVGDNYDLKAQGTGVHDIIGYYVTIAESGGLYKVYAEGKYLSDGERSDSERGGLSTEGTGDYRKWMVKQINQTDNCFGLAPELYVGGKYWQPFFADFAFSLEGSGMKAYYISAVYDDAAIIEEITSEIIPDNTPVFVACSSAKATENKLVLYKDKGTKLQDNKLKGVYFNNQYRKKSADARTAYDASTMRILGVTEEGELGFIKADLSYLPANESYLTVPVTAADELPVMTAQEYDEYLAAGVKPTSYVSKPSPVYSILGVKVADDSSSLGSLPAGIYIVNSKKVVVAH